MQPKERRGGEAQLGYVKESGKENTNLFGEERSGRLARHSANFH